MKRSIYICAALLALGSALCSQYVDAQDVRRNDKVKIERVRLWREGNDKIDITRYVRTDGVARPAMLVVPGGGYGTVCRSTEGDPIAERFASLGFQVFVLNYRVAPHRFPQPQQDILRAIKLIRANAAEWGVIKNNLAVVGFSAGGHLCASAGIFYNDVEANDGDAADAESGRPDATLLAYPVITFVGKGHLGSLRNLVGDGWESRKEEFSLERRVRQDTPPAFLWHTIDDKVVPYENSLLYAESLVKNKIPCEMHIFQKGAHGQQLGYGNEDLAMWPEQAKKFLKVVCGFKFPEAHPNKTVILTFDDACKSHIENVAPVLLKYGFGATFFICRFSDEWRAKHGDKLMTSADILQLHKWGFEIGSHSWSHPDLRRCTPEQVFDEIASLNRFLIAAGLPTPVSFAYPGGPIAENAKGTLKCHDFRIARTVERRPWDPEKDDRYAVPAFGVAGDDKSLFYGAVKQAVPGKPVVLLFHGVPDEVHPWVDLKPALFEEYMKYLHDNDFDVCSFRDYIGGR